MLTLLVAVGSALAVLSTWAVSVIKTPRIGHYDASDALPDRNFKREKPHVPAQTLSFCRLDPSATVVEIWPRD
ncbi:MAG: hypothetical protein AAF098_07985 [Pseudomonadota bacterium]